VKLCREARPRLHLALVHLFAEGLHDLLTPTCLLLSSIALPVEESCAEVGLDGAGEERRDGAGDGAREERGEGGGGDDVGVLLRCVPTSTVPNYFTEM